MKKLSKLSKYIVFSFSMVILYTIVITILTAVTDKDYSTLYTVFCGIFGGVETLGCAIIKVFNIKRTEQ